MTQSEHLVTEVAQVEVLAGHEPDFELALAEAARSVLPRAHGFIEFTPLGWCHERPSVFCFTITWATLADHIDGFRGGPLFAEWRGLIGSHFASPPVVEHFSLG